jgi:4-diphosphocytidyl-2-C-methyl-D-erythritol kinase
VSFNVFSPAKINLFLAVTGRRVDGFHDLVSVVAQVNFGDRLEIDSAPPGEFSVTCRAAGVPLDETNLVLRAARAFCAATGWTGGARFVVEKQIPVGAGLGGGSSNAVAALRGLNSLAGQPLGNSQLQKIAAGLGSDCPLFLQGGPLVMRGRGERLEPMPPSAAIRLHARRVLIFKPAFEISTAWAYGRMAEKAPGSYLPVEEAEARLAAWIEAVDAPAEELLFNNMEGPAFEKFVALPTLLATLRSRFGLAVGMSGSGSACFALLMEATPVDDVRRCIREAWGDDVFTVLAQIG